NLRSKEWSARSCRALQEPRGALTQGTGLHGEIAGTFTAEPGNPVQYALHVVDRIGVLKHRSKNINQFIKVLDWNDLCRGVEAGEFRAVAWQRGRFEPPAAQTGKDLGNARQASERGVEAFSAGCERLDLLAAGGRLARRHRHFSGRTFE